MLILLIILMFSVCIVVLCYVSHRMQARRLMKEKLTALGLEINISRQSTKQDFDSIDSI